MFWVILMVLVLGFVFFKLGVYSLTVSLLQAAVQVLLVVLGGIGLLAAWRRWRPRRNVPGRGLLPDSRKG